MTLSYNLQGPERKKLVSAISQILNAPMKYLGAPGFAYEVGPDYRIDKAGTLTGPDNHELELALKDLGFEAEASEYDAPAAGEADTITEAPAADGELLSLFDSAKLGREDGPQPCEVSQNAEVAAERSNDPQETESPQDGDPAPQETEDEPREAAPAPTDPSELTIVIPLDGFTPEKFDNLCKLVTAKETLLKAALGADNLPIRWTDEGLEFPWFRSDNGIDAEHAEAYSVFISQLCKTAISKTRITAKEKDSEGSPKYKMRSLLLALGMIGADFKDARRVLTSKLSGSSSFCTKASEERWKAKHTGRKAETPETPEKVEAPATPDEAVETEAE